jgi:serine/threonine protein kinase
VYKAINRKNGHICALKQIIKSELVNQKEYKREVKALQSLCHKHIITYIASFETDKYLEILMEYAAGGSLADLMCLSPEAIINENLCAAYTQEILSGLCFLHDNQVIHRDIKPRNILITKNGKIKLADFGASKISRVSRNCSSSSSLKGTPLYLAPETLANRKEATMKSDIWSLGCTVYEMLTGCPPFEKEFENLNPLEIVHIKKDSDEPVPIPNEISEDAQNFLDLCFKRDVALRPTSHELAEHPWVKNASKTSSIPGKSPKRDRVEENAQYMSPAERTQTSKRTLTIVFLCTLLIAAVIVFITLYCQNPN